MTILTLIPLGFLALGALSCFFGLKVNRFTIVFWGIVVGSIIGDLIARIVVNGDSSGAVVGAMAFGVLALLFYKLAIALMGVLVGGIVAIVIINTMSLDSVIVNMLLYLVFCYIGARLALLLERLFVILATAFGGALLIVQGALLLLAVETYPTFIFQIVYSLPLLAVLVWIGIGLAGATFQFGGIAGIKQQYNDLVTEIKAYRENPKSGVRPSIM